MVGQVDQNEHAMIQRTDLKVCRFGDISGCHFATKTILSKPPLKKEIAAKYVFNNRHKNLFHKRARTALPTVKPNLA